MFTTSLDVNGGNYVGPEDVHVGWALHFSKLAVPDLEALQPTDHDDMVNLDYLFIWDLCNRDEIAYTVNTGMVLRSIQSLNTK